ncbi:cob(I)yrinic acid a,c-diamide adenosyltransferase [Candidatus Aminicenantes bacterium AH-873-B07]|jgi:cob(I)alamin adenosyltransferase|nr:cob(I)yrinic acid a,c-diamide adenosyltransferase [Candidatus Aminicenantes bacterium AH-873-B07]
MSKKEKKGFVQVYTGNGKGKTTAALGLALRALGHGYRTYIGQFLKGQFYGELEAIKYLSSFITIEQFGRKGFIHVTHNTDEEDKKRAREGLEKCRKAMLSGKYKIIILDEINVALYFDLLTEEEVLKFIDQKPKQVELILTGRYAPQSIIERADLVTEMKEIKHYYHQGIKARKGFEK